MAFAAALLVALPLLRRSSGKRGDGGPDLERALYRTRVEAIEHDLVLGRISQAEATAAKAEEGRRLISRFDIVGLQAVSENDNQSQAAQTHRFLAIALFVFIPAFSLLAYSYLGSPYLPDQTLAGRKPDGRKNAGAPSRAGANLENLDISELIGRAEAHLASNPDDARGWQLIAPIYMRLERFDDAVRAFTHLKRLKPDFPEIDSRLARAKALQRAELKQTEPGPSKEDIEAASQMSAQDRKAMINSMVAGLEQKLKTDPSDKQGWQRLVRSYIVLGRNKEALGAITQALSHHGDDAEFAATLDAVRLSLEAD